MPPDAIVGGNPARVIRRRFDEPAVERLLRLRLWDSRVEKAAEVIPLLGRGEIDRLEALAEG